MMNVVVTGANKGIGLELARQYVARGGEVLALCREASPELCALKAEIVEGFDVTDLSALARLQTQLENGSIDILIHNAGIRTFETIADLDLDRIRHQFEVNAIAPLSMTHALRGKLANKAKVVLISTRAASIGDNGSGGEYGYRMSKAALNMAGSNLAIDLRKDGVSVFMLHPGFVRTDLTDGEGMVSAAESAAKLVALTDRLTIHETGGFFHADGDRLPW